MTKPDYLAAFAADMAARPPDRPPDMPPGVDVDRAGLARMAAMIAGSGMGGPAAPDGGPPEPAELAEARRDLAAIQSAAAMSDARCTQPVVAAAERRVAVLAADYEARTARLMGGLV